MNILIIVKEFLENPICKTLKSVLKTNDLVRKNRDWLKNDDRLIN